MLQYFDWLCLPYRNGCGTTILAWVSLFYLCTVDMSSLEWQFDATFTNLLSFHPTMVSSFYVAVLRSISPRLNISICFFFVMVQLPSQFSLTVPEAQIQNTKLKLWSFKPKIWEDRQSNDANWPASIGCHQHPKIITCL